MAHPDVRVMERATSVAAAQSVVLRSTIDVALVDIRLPDGTGFELIEWAKTLPAPPQFAMLTTFAAPQYVATAIRVGAKGYLLKTTATEGIVEAVRRIAGGGVAFLSEADGMEIVAAPDLTRREREIVSQLVRGRTNKEIAAVLDLSSKTVEWYLSRLFQKLGVESRTELVANANVMAGRSSH